MNSVQVVNSGATQRPQVKDGSPDRQFKMRHYNLTSCQN
jgi:hypothetical protein